MNIYTYKQALNFLRILTISKRLQNLKYNSSLELYLLFYVKINHLRNNLL